MKVLVLEPYWGGSHRSVVEGLVKWSGHEFEVLTMPARKWKWRMRGAGMWFADRMREMGGGFDVILANDMVPVADLRALAPEWARGVPVVTYFHENQLTYPMPDEDERDYQYGFTNITTCLASDEVWFNSSYHREEFLGAVEVMLRRMPDCVPEGVAERIGARSRVVWPGVEVGGRGEGERERGRGKPITVLWNHRWEWDKGPEEFFDGVREARVLGADIRVAVVGETFRERPKVFDEAREEFADIITAWGYVESRGEYLRVLREADLVVSTARHEFFGLSVVEAAACGCQPVLPRRLSYPEIFAGEGGEWAFYEKRRLGEKLAGLAGGEGLVGRVEASGAVEKYFWGRERAGEWDRMLKCLGEGRRVKQ